MMTTGTPLRRWRIASAVAALATAIGLGAGAAPAEPLRIAAAASLREPIETLARHAARHEALEVTLVFGASNALAAQIRAGAPLALLLSADERIARSLFDAGAVDRPVAFASNRMVVVVAAELAGRVPSPDDLRQTAIRRIAVPEHAVPVGRYARAWLAGAGLLEALAPRLVQTEHARATLAAVDQGHAQAALVYASDARLARSARIAFEIPEHTHPPIRYAAAVVRDQDESAAAARFVSLLRSATGRDALLAAGFAPSPDTP